MQVLIAVLSILFLAEYISTNALKSLTPDYTCRVTRILEYQNANVSFYLCSDSCPRILESYSGPGVVELLTLDRAPLLRPCVLVAINASLKNAACRRVYLAEGTCQRGAVEVVPKLLIIYNFSTLPIKAEIYRANEYLIGVEK